MGLADQSGLGAVSMRAVASRLGVTPMALYSHVPDKEAMLDGLVERLLAELRPAKQGAEWRDRLRHLASLTRAVAQRHQAVFPLLLQRPVVTTASLRVVEGIFAALEDAGVPDPDIPRLERLVSTFVLGFATSEAGGRFGPGSVPTADRRRNAPPTELPLHDRLAGVLDLPVDWDAEFDSDIENLIRLVESLASPPEERGEHRGDHRHGDHQANSRIVRP
jgi:AcrR family transcriptional regulator